MLIGSRQWQSAADIGLGACIECGCCDLVCPSHIPLTEWFRFGKSEWLREQDERTFAEHARDRFKAREERLARLKREQAERSAERKRKLASAAERQRQVARAVERAGAGKDDAAGNPGPGQGGPTGPSS